MSTSCLMKLLQRIHIFLHNCSGKELYNSCLAEKHSIIDGQTPELIKRDDRRSLRNGVFSWYFTCWTHITCKASPQRESEYMYVYIDKCMYVRIICMHQYIGIQIRKETYIHTYSYGNKTEHHRILLKVNVHINHQWLYDIPFDDSIDFCWWLYNILFRMLLFSYVIDNTSRADKTFVIWCMNNHTLTLDVLFSFYSEQKMKLGILCVTA